MNNSVIDYIVNCMASNSDVQRIQTEHRLKLAEFWAIQPGSKVLEIGCGQGDTTAVLAYLVGKSGFVHGIDVASPDYGSPITLGDSIDFLTKSDLGNRIKVDFEIDLLSTDIHFPEGYFDFVILSHSSWYLNSFEELSSILKKLKMWGKTLCFAEWDTRINKSNQLPHLLSVLIQAQYECFKESSLSNVRTLFTPTDIIEIAKNAGWNIVNELTIDSPKLQDGEWEINQTLTDYQEELNSIKNMPTKLKTLIQSEIKLLESACSNTDVKPMPIFTFKAI
ncbi:class I SAM-dependent methyltransferase [Bacillus sp. CGMCC 1.16607]|uniref:class I SAM-dependent methyltransferase n=1 Tax=Bacillus sp. CGMCC 1.16607 TaxID=3351842 RepID=UPI00362E3710